MGIKAPFQVRFRALCLYLFVLFIVYLARSYVGSFFVFLYYFLLFFPIVSLLHLLIVQSGVRYHQEFSSEHPVKGETVSYRLLLVNESFLPAPYVQVRFKRLNPFMERIMSDFSTYLAGGAEVEKRYRIQCPYRGIYTVGLAEIALEDFLRLFRVRRSVYHRTFYVYPRILYLKHFPAVIEGGSQKAFGTYQGAVPDTSLFAMLRPYRDGESLRHLDWKKFANTGSPFLKSYETTTEPGLSIYLDLRRAKHSGVEALEIEDTSVEILVALARFLLEKGIRIEIRAPGRRVYQFIGDNSAQFDEFYHSTTQLMFKDSDRGLADLYRADRRLKCNTGSALFITHLIDAGLFALIEESLSGDNEVAVVFNRRGLGEDRRTLEYFNRLRDRGARIIVVDSADTLVEDLGAARA